MAEKDYAPLTSHCVRALNDKLYEKRKAAALEIEKMVRDFNSVKNEVLIRKLLKVLGQDFTMSHNANSKKGGLIGLAAIAIALSQDSKDYIEDLVLPVLSCFTDQDSRIRYYACEALYNIVKVSRGSVLPFFNDVFDSLSKLIADPDHNVKQGCELLDRLLKDVITETQHFDLVNFIPLLRERVYTRNSFSRQFFVSWVIVLDSAPNLDIMKYLPELLDGIFCILEDPNSDIQKMCETLLGEFLKSIADRPENVDFCEMVNYLLIHAQSTDELVQFTSLTWLQVFLDKADRQLLPFASGILTAILSHFDHKKTNIADTAKSVNQLLKGLITPDDDDTMELNEVVRVLISNLHHEAMPTRLAVLHWFHHLLKQTPSQIFQHIDAIFVELMKSLQDVSEEVVMMDLKVLAIICLAPAFDNNEQKLEHIVVPSTIDITSKNFYFIKFIVALIQVFSIHSNLLEDRGPFILRELCLFLNSEDIYKVCSEVLAHQDDYNFAYTMVQVLNTILLTSSELFDLRLRLIKLNDEDSWSLFMCLYKSWCHNPVATVGLCLLSQNYKHCCDLLQLFADVEVTMDFLCEIDKLIQLIESPIFTFLRLQLLEGESNYYLIKSLYAILMLLPQGEAFHVLQNRLSCVPKLTHPSGKKSSIIKFRVDPSNINFDDMIQHFRTIQENHHKYKAKSRMTIH